MKILRPILMLLLLPYALALLYIFVPPVSTLMLADWISGHKVVRHWVPLKQMSPVLVATVLSSEDDAFCLHWGMDFNQMRRSLDRAEAENKPVRATSTISQQTAKNLFLWQGRSWLRKVLEIPLTLWLEATWPKERILEVYLNIAQWGPGIYGADAASRAYFGVPASNISPYQAALLATALPNPVIRNASRPGPGQIMLAQELMSRLQKSRPDMGCLGARD